MSSTDRLDALRQCNKDLLNQLKRQREKLECLSGFSQNRKREREGDAEERSQSAEIAALTDGDRGPAWTALAKSSLKFAGFLNLKSVFLDGVLLLICDHFRNCLLPATHERPTDTRQTISTPTLISKNSGENVQHTDRPDNLRYSLEQERLQDARPPITKSCLLNHNKKQRAATNRVTFQPDECEEILAPSRLHLQPLLGYDWIAGVLDAEDSLTERSDEFFNDLSVFRSLNKDECVHTSQAEYFEQSRSGVPPPTDKDDREVKTDTHQCTFSYRINSRLFPVPLHTPECCPVCRKDKSFHPHTTAEPALIRVSIPRTTLLPPYKYKAHRRCSFDPSDSLGLPSHCLSGWLNTGQSTLPPSSNLDLRSSMNMKSATGSQNKEMENLCVPKVSGNKISDVSRLARHNFQHFSPKRKIGSTPYLVS